MWVKQCHKPAMTGTGDDWGMARLWHCFTHMISGMVTLRSSNDGWKIHRPGGGFRAQSLPKSPRSPKNEYPC